MDFVPGFPFSLLCLSFFVILVLVLIVVVLHGWGPLTWFPIVVVDSCGRTTCHNGGVAGDAMIGLAVSEWL